MKSFVFFFCVILLCPLVLPNWTLMAAETEETPKMYIEMFEPLNNTLHPGSIFHAAIQLYDVPVSLGVVGVEFLIWWEPSVIRALNMTEVVFHELTPQSEVSNIWNAATEWEEVTDYSVYYNYTFRNMTRALNGGYAPISGNHTVAIVAFEAVSPSDAALTVSISNLYDLDGHFVTHQTIGYDLRINAWQYLQIPNLTIGGEWSIDGVMNEVAWKHAFHFHGNASIDWINVPYGMHIEYDLYMIASKKSLYLAVTVPNNHFWTDGLWADMLEVEINDRNDGCFSAEVENREGYSGNDLRELRATVSGRYTDYYFTGYTQVIDPTQNGHATYTFSGPRENGATGNYCYEMEIPFNTSDSHDAVFVDGKPFALMARYTDWVPPPEGQTWVQGWTVALISRSFLLRMTADLNGDLSVNIFDALILAATFGKNAGQPGYNENADLNGDNTIDIFDAIILVNNSNGF